ncbi:alpha/beta hydrolase [Synoicihabitans lomoniglobus]|uniref:Alpha/beta hydrolase n=1 Tax=Synoicihabitans lomoniglobus TaxID=2909285 RepID=A0AAE9ZW46_9BACT|nr:alpha/beta hydrolase [Opitutaceae bacterium LMO-M01]WED65326.1 alpha/beta hydrolase [Opitutaceae bacterium LMO-M01]
MTSFRFLRVSLFGILLPLGAAPPVSEQTLTFASVEEHTLALDLYRPTDDIVGVIIWVHGGAWRGGDRTGVDLKGMTQHGWAVASVDYRLSGDARFPAQIHDIKAAIRYLRAHADELNLPPTPFVIAGSSAGGHLAALVGVSNQSAVLEGNVGDDLETSSEVQAIVDLYGASNLLTILPQSTPHGLNVRKPALDLFIGGQPENVPEMAKLASPVYHVDARDPPLYLSHGDQDPQMPINQAHEIHGAYERLGLPVHFEVMYGSAHGGPAFTAPEELTRIDTFLRKHLHR